MVRPGLVVALALAALVGLPATTAVAGERTPPDERGRTALVVGSATRPDSLNPFVADNRLGRILTSLLYDELLRYDVDQKPLPSPVADWRRSGDGRLWLLELRKGLRWSDGTAVTARDVIHTLRRIQRDPPSRFTRWVSDITLVKRFGPRRVGVRFSSPSRRPPPLPIPLLPQQIWASVQSRDVRGFANDPPVGSGAYSSTGPTEGDTLTLAASEGHWSGEAPIDELTFRFYESQELLVEALEAGQIDVADDLGPEQLSRLEGNPDVEVRPTPATAFVSLGMNTGSLEGDGHISLRESRVRRAVAHAIDREAIHQLALGAYGAPGSTIVPPALRQHAAPPPDQELAFDPVRAGRLLARAGLHDHDGDGIREDSLGLPVELRLYTRRSLAETQRVGERIAEQLRAVGLEVRLAELTDRELTRRIRSGRYDLFIWGWDVGSDPSFIASVLSCGEARPSGLSDTYFCDGSYDRTYARYLETTNAAARDELLAELQARAYNRAPYVVLYYRPTFQAFRSDRFAAPEDDSVAIVFAPPPEQPVNLELVAAAPPPPPVDTTATGSVSAEPAPSLADEIRSSRLWQLLALAGIVVVALLLLPRVIRIVIWLGRTIGRRDRETAPNEVDADAPENDEGRP